MFCAAAAGCGPFVVFSLKTCSDRAQEIWVIVNYEQAL
jgi:hypothetical protein